MNHESKIKLDIEPYYTNPKLSDLIKSPESLKDVKNFEIGLSGVGSIRFPIADLSKIEDLRTIVQIKEREVTVYPDDG